MLSGTVFVAAALLISGCEFTNALKKADSAQGGGGTNNTGGVSSSAVTAFQTGFYAAARARCVACHGASQSPLFAVVNINAAYATSKTVVNFSNVPGSVILTKVRDGHCGANCSTNGTEWTGFINTWRAAEVAAGNITSAITPVQAFAIAAQDNLKWVTGQIVLSGNLPSANSGDRFERIRFPLSNLSPEDPDLAAAVVEIEIQKMIDGDGNRLYRIRNPRLASSVGMVQIKNIQVMINGRFDGIESAFADVDTLVTASAIPSDPSAALHTMPLSNKEILVLQDRGAGDKISLGFEVLRKADTSD
ncbi:hypothetical protein K2X30_05275 [bacterium]|jgi:hypothetical protein|nr:hypothetical protein [bacterium]